jgi:hypothetical protein
MAVKVLNITWWKFVQKSMLLTQWNKFPPYKIPHHRRQYGSEGPEHYVVEICSKKHAFNTMQQISTTIKLHTIIAALSIFN